MIQSNPALYVVLFVFVLAITVTVCFRLQPLIKEATGSGVLSFAGCWAFGFAVGQLFNLLVK